MSRNLLPLYGSGRNPTGPLAFESIGEFYQPTVGEVMSAQYSSSLRGPGSSAADVFALELERELGTNQTGIIQQGSDFLVGGLFRTDDTTQPSGVKISQEEWKESPFFHPAVEYQEGMTTLAAELLKRQAERNEENEFLISQAQGLVKNGLGYAAGFAGGMADAKGAAVGVAAAVATPLVVGGFTAPAAPVVGGGAGVLTAAARIGPTLARMNSAGFQVLKQSRKARFAAIGGEAAVSTVPQVITGFQNSSLTQQDYEMVDAMFDFATGAGFALAFQGATEGIAAAWKRYARQDGMVEVAQLAARQIELGEKVDVQPIIQAQLSDFTPSRIELPEPTVRQLPDGQWEAALDNQIFVGRTQADVTAQAREIALSESLQPLREMGYSPQALARVEEALRYKTIVEPELQRRQQIEQSRAQAVANLERTSVMRAQQLSDTLVRVKKERDETQRALSALRKEVKGAESKLKSTPSVAGRNKKLASIKAKITNFEKKIFENPEAFAFFDDRVLAAFVRLEKATKLRDKKPNVAREQEVLKAREDYEQALKQVLDNPASIVDFVPEIQVLRNNLTEAAESFRDIQLGQREIRRTRALERLQVQARLAEMEIARRDQFIRQLQRRQAVQTLPDFTRKQLDSSPEARAARSQNPEAARMVAQPIPEARGVDSEDVPLPTAQEIARVEAELADTPLVDDPKTPLESVKKAIAEADAVLDDGFETSVERFVRCWSGR
jgi:hypothetical protein